MKKNFRSLRATAWLMSGALAMASHLPAGARQPAVVVALTGYVFEDPNYGGGAGRPLGTAGTSPRSGATVELYDATGTYLGTTTTNAAGQYSFNVNSATTYQVRVVNASVSSSRAGYTTALLPVQTYAGAANETDAANRVGGAVPQLADAPANQSGANLTTLTTATTTAESVVPVAAGNADTAGPSFGYCFDLVVNTNDSGQGSLRQFVLNAGALGGEGDLAQRGFTRSTTSTNSVALAAGRENSIFMIPDGQAHPGLRATTAGGPASGLSTQNGQQVAVITLTVSSGGLLIQGANPTLTTIDGGTQTANIGNTNAAVLGMGGSVGTSASLSYTSFSGPEVQLLGEYNAANPAGSRKPRNGINVLADDFTLRNLALRNFGNPGGQSAVGFDNVPGRSGPLAGSPSQTGAQGAVRALLENNVFGADASSFAAPSPFASNEGDNGRNNQHIQYDVSGTSATVNTLTVRTNLLGFSERRALHVQGNSTLASGYNINLSASDNVFQEAGVGGNPFSTTSPYFNSAAGAVELIMTTMPYLEVFNNRISGPGTATSYQGLGSDGLEINNAQVTSTNPNDPVQVANNARRDAGAAQPGSRVEQNSVSNQRLAMLCQSNAAYSRFALDNVLFRGNSFTNNYVGAANQGAGHQVQNNVITGSTAQGFVNTGPNVTFTGNTFNNNGTLGLQIGDAMLPQTDDNRPAVTGVVVGPGNVLSANGTIGLSVVNSTTRTTITQNSHYANGSLGIDLVADGVTANNNVLNQGVPNQELDYPILSAATLTGSQLTISGYVGTGAGQPAFAGALIEFFLADNNPANQNGPLVAGDGKSEAHGEGRTYLGSLTADGNGNFSGSFAASGVAGGSFVTATATLSSGAQASTSEFGNNIVVVTVLPVTLVAFEAQALGSRDARLSWTTASELHNDHFDVERSLDGSSFTKLGQVAGQGSKASATTYAFTDAGIGARLAFGQGAYYRLRQVDLDGTATYSPVRSVRFGEASAVAISLYPNPAGAGTTLDLSALPAAASYQLRVLDAVGRPVQQATLSGGQATRLDLSSLAPGSYQLLLTGPRADGSALRQLLRLTRE